MEGYFCPGSTAFPSRVDGISVPGRRHFCTKTPLRLSLCFILILILILHVLLFLRAYTDVEIEELFLPPSLTGTSLFATTYSRQLITMKPFFPLFALILLALGRRGTAQASCFGPRIPGTKVVPLSAAKNCFQSVKLDPDATIQGINSYFGTLKAMYTFYNIARDAPDSSPIGTQVSCVSFSVHHSLGFELGFELLYWAQKIHTSGLSTAGNLVVRPTLNVLSVCWWIR